MSILNIDAINLQIEVKVLNYLTNRGNNFNQVGMFKKIIFFVTCGFLGL